jgi:hypothetical protein
MNFCLYFLHLIPSLGGIWYSGSEHLSSMEMGTRRALFFYGHNEVYIYACT